MSCLNAINKIPAYIGIEKASQKIGGWLDKHPTVNKIVMIANHIFRIVAMVGMMHILPFHPLINFGISFAASLFYRVTVERFCPYRFALTSCLAAGAFQISKPHLLAMIRGVAFRSFGSFGVALAGTVPLLLSAAVIIIISNHQVDEKYAKQNRSSCGSCVNKS